MTSISSMTSVASSATSIVTPSNSTTDSARASASGKRSRAIGPPTRRIDMPKFHLILENVGGKLDERVTDDVDEAELVTAVTDFALDIGSFRDGDIIRIVEES